MITRLVARTDNTPRSVGPGAALGVSAVRDVAPASAGLVVDGVEGDAGGLAGHVDAGAGLGEDQVLQTYGRVVCRQGLGGPLGDGVGGVELQPLRRRTAPAARL